MSFLRQLCNLTLKCAKQSSTLKLSVFPVKQLRFNTLLMPKLNYCSTGTDEKLTYDEHYVYEEPKSEDEVVNVSFRDREGNIIPIKAKIGDNILRLAHRYEVDLEGSCNGVAACSTCHVYVEGDYFDLLEEPSDEEQDMLDLASMLKPESRLGCQIYLTKEMEGMVLGVPANSRNFYVDGHVPKPH